MRKRLALLLLCLPMVLPAQSILPIPDRQCVWRSGDDLAWAAPALDETAWKPAGAWDPGSYPPRVWMRCHADLERLRTVEHPAVQIVSMGAYELFVDGKRVGSMGDLRSGIFSEDNMRSHAIPGDLLGRQPAVLALRLSVREPGHKLPQISAGDAAALEAEHARVVVGNVTPSLPSVIGYFVLGILGLVQLGLYLYDRSRRDLLLLSLVCLGLAALRLNELCAAALVDYSIRTRWTIWFVCNFLPIAQVGFFFSLVRRRVPWYLWPLLAVAMGGNGVQWIGFFLPVERAYWLAAHVERYVGLVTLPVYCLLMLAPFAAMLPWSRVPRRLHVLAVLCLVWGTSDFVYFVVQITSLNLPGIPDLWTPWHYGLFVARASTQGAVLVALLWLLFHDHRRIVEERAQLAGELQSAREIQRMLAPAQISTAPGLVIEVAFRPMREVGGDFYLCRVLADGRQRLLVGDVSGKGTAAAMTAALLLGGAEDHDDHAPGQLLAHLDRVLRESRVGGFATCVCADLAPDGEAVIANAGHLPPYCRGEEIPVPASLPLGTAREPKSGYEETVFHLAPGDTITFLSDGVVEARSHSGELFGFERTRELSLQPAEKIAEAAQRFGQEDDITVLRLTLEGVPVGA